MQPRRRQRGSRWAYRWRVTGVAVSLVLGGLFLAGLVTAWKAPDRQASPQSADGPGTAAVRFTDAHQQAAEFISYHHAIALSTEQQRVMEEGLSPIAAPCCDQHTIATCCCPCNLAKSAWGLSKLLIARHGANAGQVRTAVTEWLQFINPGGYTGDACFTRGCNRPFEENGCGGMDDRYVVQ